MNVEGHRDESIGDNEVKILLELRKQCFSLLQLMIYHGRLGLQESNDLQNVDQLIYKVRDGIISRDELVEQIRKTMSRNSERLSLIMSETAGSGINNAVDFKLNSGMFGMREVALGASIFEHADRFMTAVARDGIELPDLWAWKALSPDLRSLVDEPKTNGSFYRLWFKAVNSQEFSELRTRTFVEIQLNGLDSGKHTPAFTMTDNISAVFDFLCCLTGRRKKPLTYKQRAQRVIVNNKAAPVHQSSSPNKQHDRGPLNGMDGLRCHPPKN
jgi:hypothetical protein